jgi:hypothetical protein
LAEFEAGLSGFSSSMLTSDLNTLPGSEFFLTTVPEFMAGLTSFSSCDVHNKLDNFFEINLNPIFVMREILQNNFICICVDFDFEC